MGGGAFQDSSDSETESGGGRKSESDSGAETESKKKSESKSEKEEKKDQKKDLVIIRQYGNFRGYYKKRNAGYPEKDSRLEFLRKEWFEDKECLDIGSNDGTLIICIAKMFRCESILAIDIDPGLVERANKNLRKAVEKSKKQIGDLSRNLIDVVTFKQENFVESEHPELYDTVTCFSVTQWIHLNYGDAGLVKFFLKIWEVLRPGGVLILEPQAWKSYVLKHYVSPITAEKFKEIKLRPKDFQKILLNRIGFKTVQHINPSWLKARLRYNRPILVFKK